MIFWNNFFIFETTASRLYTACRKFCT